MKLMCRCDTPVSSDNSNWLLPRMSRQWRNSTPNSEAGGLVLFDEVGGAEVFRGDDGEAVGEGFEDNEAERIRLRRESQDVQVGKRPRQCLAREDAGKFSLLQIVP